MNLMLVRLRTTGLVITLAVAMATSALASCMADPSMSAAAQMECCRGGHDQCPMRGSAADCCKIDNQKHQPLAVAKAEPVRSTLAASALVATVIVGSMDSVAPVRAARVLQHDPLRIPSTPDHFLASALLL